MLINFDVTVSSNRMNGVSVSATPPSHHLFLHYVPIYRLSICLSKKRLKADWGNVIAILGYINKIDLIWFDNLMWTQFDSQNLTPVKRPGGNDSPTAAFVEQVRL